LVAIFSTTLLVSLPVEAKVAREYFHIFSNGCIGKHYYHSALFGIFKWETYEVIACPPGASADDVL